MVIFYTKLPVKGLYFDALFYIKSNSEAQFRPINRVNNYFVICLNLCYLFVISREYKKQNATLFRRNVLRNIF